MNFNVFTKISTKIRSKIKQYEQNLLNKWQEEAVNHYGSPIYPINHVKIEWDSYISPSVIHATPAIHSRLGWVSPFSVHIDKEAIARTWLASRGIVIKYDKLLIHSAKIVTIVPRLEKLDVDTIDNEVVLYYNGGNIRITLRGFEQLLDDVVGVLEEFCR